MPTAPTPNPRIAVVCLTCGDVANHESGLVSTRLFDLGAPTYRFALWWMSILGAQIYLDGRRIDVDFYERHKHCQVGWRRFDGELESPPDHWSELVMARKDELKGDPSA